MLGGECSLADYCGKLIKLTLRFWWKFQVNPLEKKALLILGSAWHSFFQRWLLGRVLVIIIKG